MKEISAKELLEKIEAGETLNLIDVREQEELEAERIPGIVHIPLGEITSRIDEFDKNKAYIFVCRSGGRSGQVTRYLEELGYDATNMTGGMISWRGEVTSGKF